MATSSRTKRKTTTTRKKKVVGKKKTTIAGNGLKKYTSFIKRDPAVKRATESIKKLEKQIAEKKKLKQKASEAAKKKYHKTKK